MSEINKKTAFRIVLVDDSIDNQMLLTTYLSKCGFEFDYAENGLIAVEKVNSNHPDIVLMDLYMPVMDGFEATRAIRQWETQTQTLPIPILAVTAVDAVGGESLVAGCNEHLVKPIERSVLLEAILRHLG